MEAGDRGEAEGGVQGGGPDRPNGWRGIAEVEGSVLYRTAWMREKIFLCIQNSASLSRRQCPRDGHCRRSDG